MEHTSPQPNHDSIPTLLPELVREIFFYTNVETVVSGMSASRTFRTILSHNLSIMMYPPNFRMQLCGEYQDNNVSRYQLSTAQNEPYVLGQSLGDENYQGFTCMVVVRFKEVMLFFGYSQHHYVMISTISVLRSLNFSVFGRKNSAILLQLTFVISHERCHVLTMISLFGTFL